MNFVRDQPAQAGLSVRLSLLLVVASIHHDITPNGWITTVGTSRSVSNLVTYQWDAGISWDADPAFQWDGQPPVSA